jgi:hypothetical protein
MEDLSLRGNLEDCEREIERLKEENDYLRDASVTFGELAERLQSRLARAGGDRPAGERPGRRE